MSQRTSGAPSLVLENARSFFEEQVEGAFQRLHFHPLPLSRHYLIDLLQHYLFSANLFPPDDETGKARRDTLAEMWLRAQNAPAPQRLELLKKLGDSSLYISGFFGDSLARKVVDIDYYVDMGGVAYQALSATAADEHQSQMFDEYARRFAEFVDVLTYISQSAMVQTNEDLLKLYDRYIATGSRLAEEQLAEKGLISADLQKVKVRKM